MKRENHHTIIFISHFPQKNHMISGSFAERDPQLKASYGSSPPCSATIFAKSSSVPQVAGLFLQKEPLILGLSCRKCPIKIEIASAPHPHLHTTNSLSNSWRIRMGCRSVSQCVAVCCGVVYWVVVCCSVLQCVAVCCSVLQGVAVCYSVLKCVVVVAVCCSVLQCVEFLPVPHPHLHSPRVHSFSWTPLSLFFLFPRCSHSQRSQLATQFAIRNHNKADCLCFLTTSVSLVCMHIYIYICTCTYMYNFRCKCEYTIHMYVYTYAYKYINVCIHT